MSGAASLTDGPAQASAAIGEPALPRLLAGIPEHGVMDLRTHLSVHGSLPSVRARRRGEPSPLIARVARAGLRGRGGAGFPTATKLRAVASARGRATVVINAAEGEPASFKDRTLAQTLPHLLLDGGQLAAQAVGADELIVCVCESAPASLQSLGVAMRERATRGEEGARTELAAVPSHYVAGQESALVNYLGGGPAVPTFTPPRPFEQGVRRRPTLVSNAETLAHLALIARHGSQWFRQLGTAHTPGSALVTLSGPVAHPGVYEIEHGASLASLLDAAGGTTAKLRGALLGGYAGRWIAGSQLDELALCDEQLAQHGASLGAGVVLLLSEHACPVAETARVARWLAQQSTRQCGPCLNGLDALAQTLEQIAQGAGDAKAMRRVGRLAALVQRRGACGHPDGAVQFALSAVEAFAADFQEHARDGRCPGCAAPTQMPLGAPSARPSAAVAHAHERSGARR